MNAVKIPRQCSIVYLWVGKKDCMLMAVYLNCNWKNILTKKTSMNTPSCTPIKQEKEVPQEIIIAAAK